MIGYGLVDPTHLRRIAVGVCDVLGHGKEATAVDFLLEICAQETHSGKLRDRHATAAGVGVCQIDPVGFRDVLARTDSYPEWVELYEVFGIEKENLKYEMLAYSPLLALVICRLFLRLIPEPFPASVEGRAEYWKCHYNTKCGKGTPEEYLLNVKVHKV